MSRPTHPGSNALLACVLAFIGLMTGLLAMRSCL